MFASSATYIKRIAFFLIKPMTYLKIIKIKNDGLKRRKLLSEEMI